MLELLLSELCCYRTFIRVTTSDQSEWSIQERCDVSSDENRDDPPTETSFFESGYFFPSTKFPGRYRTAEVCT